MSLPSQEIGNHSRILKQGNFDTEHLFHIYWKDWRSKGKILSMGGKEEIGREGQGEEMPSPAFAGDIGGGLQLCRQQSSVPAQASHVQKPSEAVYLGFFVGWVIAASCS